MLITDISNSQPQKNKGRNIQATDKETDKQANNQARKQHTNKQMILKGNNTSLVKNLQVCQIVSFSGVKCSQHWVAHVAQGLLVQEKRSFQRYHY